MPGSKTSPWRVGEATFEQSAATIAGCPPPTVPEIAIAGRSNVGKSSLLNALVGRRGLARVSRTPGRTQLLNVFRLVLHGPGHARHELRLVDLPGYGHAAAAPSVREGFAPMVGGYLRDRAVLLAVVLLVDVRRGLGDLDWQMLEFLAERPGARVPSLLVGTKADKLGAAERGLVRRKLADAVGVQPADVLLTSARTGFGLHDVDGLTAALAELLHPAAEES